MNQPKEVNKWLVAATMSVTSVMVLLDMTIANVALPHMMGTFGATSHQITWVLTAYTMAEAIFIPLTGFLSKKLGQRQLLLISVPGFVVTSMLCGQADSLEEMVFFRILQGAFGASSIPLSQSVIASVFPREERGKAMAIFSMGLVMGPVLGPTLGGIITEYMSWRWIFYINLPVGFISVLCIYSFIHISDKGKTVFDWVAMITMAIGLGLFQIVMDQGDGKDWFSSQYIILLSCLSAAFVVFFVFRSLTKKSDVLPLWLLKDRNLVVASIIMAFVGTGLFGTLALQPIMMQKVMGYPVETTGLLMASRGVASAITLIAVAQLVQHVSSHILVGFGLFLTAASLYMMSGYALVIDDKALIIPSAIQGIGMAFIFVPLSTAAYETLDEKYRVSGVGIFNLFRTVGSSIGISIASTFQTRMNDDQFYSLATGIEAGNPIWQNSLSALAPLVSSEVATQFLILGLMQQAAILSYIDSYRFFCWIFLCMLPLILLFKKGKMKTEEM